jgi:hypothetical protein
MSGTCNIHLRKQYIPTQFLLNFKKRDHLEDMYVDGKIVLKRILEKKV